MNRLGVSVLRDPVHLVSTGFGLGLAPFAPGTFGTLLGVALDPVLRLLAQPPVRFPARFGRAGVRRTRYGRYAPVAQTCGGPFSGPPCNALRH